MGCNFLWVDFADQIAPPIYVAISIIAITIALPGNLFTAMIIVRQPNLRNEPTYLLICSVCIADVLVSAVVQPLFICTMLLGTRENCVLDNFYYVTAWISAMASGIGVLPITLERYIYIVHPLHYRFYVTKKRAQIVIIMLWTISFMFGIIPLIWYHQLFNHSASLLIVLIISFGMVFAYGRIYNRVTSIAPDLTYTTSNVVEKRRKKNRIQGQATRTVFFVVLSFFICWFPYLLVSFIIALFNGNNTDNLPNFTNRSALVKIYWGSLLLGYCNSAINVFIYVRKNSVLRKAIGDYIRKYLRSRIDENDDGILIAIARKFGFYDKNKNRGHDIDSSL